MAKIKSSRTTRSDKTGYESKRDEILNDIAERNGEKPTSNAAENAAQSAEKYKQLRESRKLKIGRNINESEEDALRLMQDLSKKNLKKLKASDIQPGNLVYFKYTASTVQQYDKTPLTLFIKSKHSAKYILGINLHFAPQVVRKTIIRGIMKIARNEIKQGKPINLSYRQLKPFLTSVGGMPIIRLYIKSQIGSKGIVIPPEYMLKVMEHVPPESLTGGMNAEQIYRDVIARAKQGKSKRGSRTRVKR